MQYIFESNRLYFRKFEIEDTQTLFALNADERVIRYTGDLAFESVVTAKRFIQNYRDYDLYGIGRWMMIEKLTMTALGWCGLKYLPDLQEIDLGYRLFHQYWNQGYATEASLATLNFGFEVMQFDEIVGRAWKINVASIRVLEKCGMVFWKDAIFDQQPGSYYKISKKEYLNKT